MGDEFAPARLRVFNGEGSSGETPGKLIGRVIGVGAADDAHDKRFLAVDGADGNQWRVDVDLAPGAMPPADAVIEVSCRSAEPKTSDRTIAAIAERNAGVYSEALHAASDPKASAEYRLTHKRRLEALRRAGIVEREPDGAWRIPNDYLDRARSFESDRAGVQVCVLSWVAIEETV